MDRFVIFRHVNEVKGGYIGGMFVINRHKEVYSGLR